MQCRLVTVTKWPMPVHTEAHNFSEKPPEHFWPEEAATYCSKAGFQPLCRQDMFLAAVVFPANPVVVMR